jgi:predicted metal-dependent hydrolase
MTARKRRKTVSLPMMMTDLMMASWETLSSDGDQVEIYVHKVRDKWVGKPGMVTLRYDRVTGRYFETMPVNTSRNWGDR